MEKNTDKICLKETIKKSKNTRNNTKKINPIESCKKNERKR